MSEIAGDSQRERVVLITGAGQGIGRAIAHGFAAEGAFVVVNDTSASGLAPIVAREIEEAGGSALAAEADVADEEQVDGLAQRLIDDLGHVDVLVNNAGVTSHVPFVELSVAEWDRVISINLRGVFLCCRAIAPTMLERGGGIIINMASDLGLCGAPLLAHYSASKGGVLALTKALAKELAPTVRVNAVAPGPIETEMLTVYPDEFNETTLSQIPLARWGQPEDAAASVVFLASAGGSYYTGWVLSPNGGAVV